MENTIPAGADFTYVNGQSDLKRVSRRLDTIGSFVRNTAACCAVSNIITIPAAQGTTNNELLNFIPENSLLTSVGVFFTENANIQSSGTLAVAFGNASADVSIVASTILNAAGTDIVLNSFTSTSTKHALTSGGNAIAMAADSALYFVNGSSLFFQTIVAGGSDLTALCQVKVVVEFIPYVTNS